MLSRVTFLPRTKPDRTIYLHLKFVTVVKHTTQMGDQNRVSGSASVVDTALLNRLLKIKRQYKTQQSPECETRVIS